jgi:four helix bundle protein
MENNIILGEAIWLAKEVVSYCRGLSPDCKVLANQLMRSGTSVGAMITEAQSAESRLDFIHKFKMADKEARETLYWLNILKNVDRSGDQEKLRHALKEIQKLLHCIISASRKQENEKSGK